LSIDGEWNMTMKTTMGPQSGSLVLKTEGGSLSGTVTTRHGPMDFSNGTVSGNELAWSTAMTSPIPMTLEFTATVDGDKITGKVKLGSFATGDLEGTRA
jgi:hypothetical protein